MTDEVHAQAVEAAQMPRGAVPFEEVSFVIPLREERVEFTKSTHVWQEVRVSKEAQEELRAGAHHGPPGDGRGGGAGRGAPRGAGGRAALMTRLPGA